MDYYDLVDMMICYLIIFVSRGAIEWFILSVQDSRQIKDVDGIDGPPWTPDGVREWTIYGLSIFFIAYVTYDGYIMMLIMDR
jgi:hypothetical protein